MKSAIAKPRFNIREMLLWFVFVAVALSIGVGAPDEYSRVSPFERVDWEAALVALLSLVMVRGLMQESVALWRLGSDTKENPCLLAASLRATLALFLTLCLIVVLLISRGLVALPEHQDLFLFEDVFPMHVWQVCVIVTLVMGVGRWSSSQHPHRKRRWLGPVACIAVLVLGLLVLPNAALLHYLVHHATEEIDREAAVQWQRYPDHAQEGFRLFWLSCGMILNAVMSWGLFVWLTRYRCARLIWREIVTAALLASLSAGAIFCWWYFTTELPRVAPDLVTSYSVTTWPDWLGGGMLLLILGSAFALRSGGLPVSLADREESPVRAWQQPKAHESPLYSALLLAYCVWLAIGQICLIWEFANLMTPGRSVMNSIANSLSYPDQYLYYAIILVGFHFCWLRWRHRGEQLQPELLQISPRAFLSTLLGFLILASVTVPTAAAYCFVFWLGPWHGVAIPWH